MEFSFLYYIMFIIFILCVISIVNYITWTGVCVAREMLQPGNVKGADNFCETGALNLNVAWSRFVGFGRLRWMMASSEEVMNFGIP
jgi:hypothetical protein